MITPRRQIRGILRIALRASVCTLCIGLLAVAVWQVAIRMMPAPPKPAFARPATFVSDGDGQLLAAFVGQDDAWYLPLKEDEISPHLKNAIVAVEDRRFRKHSGVDWRSVAVAAWQDLCAMSIRRGASTITMQVIRLRDPRPRSWSAKMQQAFRASQLELTAGKDEILTEYINRAPFGGNLVGAGAASWRYFGRPCNNLSLGQAALLAGLPQSPNRMRPDRSPEDARIRRTHVLQQMLALNMINVEEAATANAEPIDAIWRPLPQQENIAAMGALACLTDLADRHRGQHLSTTIDRRVQSAAWRLLKEQWGDLQSSGIDSAVALVIDVPTGHVLANASFSSVAPSVDFSRAARSTGSVLKPFIYATAFDLGILTPQSEIQDSPKAWAGYVPANFDHHFAGRLTAADALAESRNIPAMIVLARAGIERTLGVMDAAGIHSTLASSRRYGLSLAIGGAEATPFEIAEAYATLARGGLRIPSTLLSERQSQAVRVLPETICYSVLRCISQPDRTALLDGGAVAARLETAWKTGTSNGFRDAWCAAATPRRVVVIWLGNCGGKGSPALIGQEAAAPLALKLIGMIDSGGATWPTTQRADVPSASIMVRPDSERLGIVSPAQGCEIICDGQNPRIRLSSTGGVGQQRWWFANGQWITTALQDEPATWSPSAGQYDLRVVDEAGEGTRIKVMVR